MSDSQPAPLPPTAAVPLPLDLPGMIRFVGERAPVASDLERTAIAAATAQHLARLGDEVVGHYVEVARAGGASWSQIGERLGVTRQAAQQRWPTSDPLRLLRLIRGRPVRERFTVAAVRAVSLGSAEARRAGHATVGSEHLLLGLLHDPPSRMAALLGTYGVDLDTARAEVASARPPDDRSTSAPATFTVPAQHVLHVALTEALRDGVPRADLEHLLTAVAIEPDGLGGRLLRATGLRGQALRAAYRH